MSPGRSTGRLSLAWAAGCLVLLGWGFGAAPVTAIASAPQVIVNESVSWISVSPDFLHSGVAVAVGTPNGGCTEQCTHLWVTHDGGYAWARASTSGWAGGQVTVAVDGRGHEILFSSGNPAQRSDDGGATWTSLGVGGLPAPSPGFAGDGLVAVAGAHDVLIGPVATTPVKGSGRALAADISFMLAPGFPASGQFSPALLAGADQQTGGPVVQRCDRSLSCSGRALLPVRDRFGLVVTLHPSTNFTSDGTAFAQSGEGIFRTADGGATFTQVLVAPANGASVTVTPMLSLAPGFSQAGPVRTAYAAILQTFTDQAHASTPHGGASIDPRMGASRGMVSAVAASSTGGRPLSRLGLVVGSSREAQRRGVPASSAGTEPAHGRLRARLLGQQLPRTPRDGAQRRTQAIAADADVRATLREPQATRPARAPRRGRRRRLPPRPAQAQSRAAKDSRFRWPS